MPDSDRSYLREPPDSATRVPPPTGDREADLPLGEMGWKNFERLCLTYGETTDDFVDTSFYGTEGQRQQGIDVVLRYADARQVTIQCRRVKTMPAAKLKKAVDDFLAGRFAASSKRFVLATAADTSDNKIQDEFDRQFKRLADAGIEFQLWGRHRLSQKLRDEPQLLWRFFGEPWRDLYRPDLAKENLKNTVEAQGQRVIDVLGDKAERLSEQVKNLSELGTAQSAATNAVTPELLERLTELAVNATELEPDVGVVLADLADVRRSESMQLFGAGVDRDPGKARQLILVPTAWVQAGSADLWNALGRLASAAGHWPEAEEAFLRAADAASEQRATYFVRAHDAALADDRPADADRHLAAAKQLEPQLIAVRVAELDEIEDPAALLLALDELQPVTAREQATVARVRVDALARLERFDEALTLIDLLVAERSTWMAGVDRRAGITVLQQSRELSRGREPDRTALRRAADDSKLLAERLRSRQRLTESGGCLARAADALALAGDDRKALALLDQLTGAEREVQAVRLAACQAAIHARKPELALTLLGDEAGWADDERYAAAHALVLSDEPDRRARAVEIAREALDAGREPERAAFVLLLGAVGDAAMPWPEDAAAVMQAHDPVMHAQLRSERLLLEDRDGEAEELLLAHADDNEVLRTLVDRQLAAERYGPALSMAERLVSASGRGEDRMRRAAALRGLGRREQLLAELRALADDDQQPEQLRRRAYRALSSEVADRDFPELARLSEEWRSALPDDADAVAQSVFALARLARHDEALTLMQGRAMEARTVAEAQLMAEVYFRAAPPLEAARRVAALSDQFDRPEPLEGLLLLVSLHAPDADPKLAQRIGETYRTFEQRFPESDAIRTLTFDEEHPEEFLDFIRETLRERRDRANAVHADVRNGHGALAILAAATGRHIGEIALRIEALPLGFSDSDLDDHELKDARDALGQGAVWDPVSLTVVAGLPDAVQQPILARLPGSSVAASTMDEVDAAVATLNDAADGQYMSLAGEQVEFSAIPAEQLERERETLTGALALVRDHMSRLMDVDPGAPDAIDAILSSAELHETLATWPATVSVARRQGVAVYSDDRFVRVSARREGVPAFGTLALLSALRERGALSDDELREVRLALARRGAWGMRPAGDELAALAAEQGWQPVGPWAQVLADPAAWRNNPDGQLRLGVEFLRRVHAAASEQLEDWTARLIDLGRHASDVHDADDIAVGLLVYGWLSPSAFADMPAHRLFAVWMVRALRAAPRRLVVASFDNLVERSAAVAIASTTPRLRGEMFKWILRQVTFLDAELMIAAFVG